jgi:capsular exopolysaccharide synthesis family protein
MNEMTAPDSQAPRSLDRFLPDAAESEEAAGFRISLADLRGMLWRQRKIIGAIIAGALLLGVVITLLMQPVFQASTSVQIDNESTQIVEGQSLDPAIAVSETNRYLNTQKLVVESRKMAGEVADALNLARDWSFIERMGGKKVELTGTPAQQRAARQEAVVALLKANVSVDVRPDNRIGVISFTSPDPALAATIANSYAENYIAQNVQRGYDTNVYARRILSQQVAETQANLRETERKAIDYARRNRLIDTGDASSGETGGQGDSGKSGSSRSVTTASLVQLNSAYVDAKAARIAAEQRWRAVAGVPGTDLPEARTNPVIQQLLQDRAAAQTQLAQLRERYQPGQPQVEEQQARVAELNRQIAQAGTRLKNSVRSEYEIARRQEAQIDAALKGLADKTLAEQDRRVQLNLIARDADTQRNQLNSLLTRLNQINSAADIVTNNISLLDRATVPTSPISPNFKRNLMIALALGLALAVFVSFVREALDDTLRSPEDVESKLHLPLLGTTPLVEKEVANLTTARSSDLGEAYFSIRASVEHASAGSASKIYLVTSSQPGEGKSTTALSLARDFAYIGRKVLLIDADLRNPSLHRALEIDRSKGLIDVVAGIESFDSVVLRGITENLDVLPLGPIPPNPVQLLSSPATAELLEARRKDYDLIILDSAPVMGLADTPLLSRVADYVILIVEANRAHFGQAKSAIRRLQDAGATILGVVMSKFSYREAGYGYNYHYSYYAYGGDKPR